MVGATTTSPLKHFFIPVGGLLIINEMLGPEFAGDLELFI
jgi:hypothetical protein